MVFDFESVRDYIRLHPLVLFNYDSITEEGIKYFEILRVPQSGVIFFDEPEINAFRIEPNFEMS